MASSAGKVGSGNEGKTDKDRGSSMDFSYSKDKRDNHTVSGGSVTSNPNDKAGLSKKVNDPRLA